MTADNYAFQQHFAAAPEVTRDWDLPEMPDMQIRAIQLDERSPGDVLMDADSPDATDILIDPIQSDASDMAPQPSTSQVPSRAMSAAELTQVLESPVGGRPALAMPNLFAAATAPPVEGGQLADSGTSTLELRGGIGTDDELMEDGSNSSHTEEGESRLPRAALSDEDEEGEDRPPQLAFADEDPDRLFFPPSCLGKVGGLPGWMDPVRVDAGSFGQLICASSSRCVRKSSAAMSASA